MNQKKIRIRKRFSKGKYMCKNTMLPALLVLCLLSGGCTLARPELQEPGKKEDEICGILAAVGEQEARRQYEREQEGQTFSGLRELEESLTAAVCAEGIQGSDRSIAFEGVEGHMIGILKETREEYPGTRFVNDGFFTEVKADVNVTDEGTRNSISGTILAQKGLSEPIYLYPVYIREDGSFYAALDASGFLIGGVHDEGEVYTKSFSSEITEEINGNRKTDSTEISVSVKAAEPVERVSVREYGAEHELLKLRELSKGTGEVLLQEETAYVMVEEEKQDGSIQRSVYDVDESQAEGDGIAHSINYSGDGGLIEPVELLFVKKGSP